MLAAVGINGEPGTNFGMPACHARLNLMGSPSSWDLLLPRLQRLCSTPPTRILALVDYTCTSG